MRILIFHGYLLAGTGSNVYNARLAAALVKLGHEVHLLSQDRHPERQPFVDELGDWDRGALRMRTLRAPISSRAGRCTVYRPNIGALLPVYVADRYEGIEARTFAQCSEEELARYLDANVAAVAELLARVGPQVALANHLVMGPVILARALAGEVPYAVKVHGSALEYTVKPEPERFLKYAREGVAGARAILVGSHHTAASMWEALEDPRLLERTRLGPPGVDVERFSPLHGEEGDGRAGEGQAHRGDRRAGVARLRSLASALRAGAAVKDGADSAFARDGVAAAQALESLRPDDRLVAFVGKLIVSKGVDLLLAAWPLVLQQVPRARLVVVGFGAYRPGLERLLDAFAAGELDRAREVALRGRALESPSCAPRPLAHLLAFLASGAAASEEYLRAAATLPDRVTWCGRLDHAELAEILPACEAQVVPSTFPEAFGMVAAEAAACGVLPVSAAHSGLAEVTRTLGA
ncbi:MAG: glycosyltransferase, partial [Actinomycetota bacterium]|nr:glycosyltransferase [Actinomycetota bacterium]